VEEVFVWFALWLLALVLVKSGQKD